MVQSDLGLLLRWLQSLEYNDIRRAESVQSVEVTLGSTRKPLRGVQVASDLVLGRDRRFYRIIDGHAVVMPSTLVSEQYNVKELERGYTRALRTQPRSTRVAPERKAERKSKAERRAERDALRVAQKAARKAEKEKWSGARESPRSVDQWLSAKRQRQRDAIKK